jgi:hypothetical protein
MRRSGLLLFGLVIASPGWCLVDELARSARDPTDERDDAPAVQSCT